jgi:transposase
VPVPDCPTCHGPLTHRRTQHQYQIDLPPIVPIVTRFDVDTGFCPHCQKRVQGQHPEQISAALGAANVVLGPGVLALALDLKYGLGVGFRKIARLFSRRFHLAVQASTLVRAAERWAERAKDFYEGLKADLRNGGRTTHGDETSWPVGGNNQWLWVFTSPHTTVFVIHPSRGHDVVVETLGEKFLPPLVCDGLATYDALPGYLCPRCSAHVLRRIKKLSEFLRGADLRQLQRLEALWKEALSLAKRRTEMTRRGYERRVTEILHRFAAWLADHGRRPGPELQRLAKHLEMHRDEWFLFLFDEMISATNTAAERKLQIALPSRKLGAGTRTERGSMAHSIWSSIVATLNDRGRDFYNWLKHRMRSPPDPTSR